MKNVAPRPLLVLVVLAVGVVAALPFQKRKLGKPYDTGKSSPDDLVLRRQLRLELSQQSDGIGAAARTNSDRSNGSSLSSTPYRPPAIRGSVRHGPAMIDGVVPPAIRYSEHNAINRLSELGDEESAPPEMSSEYRRVRSFGIRDPEQASDSNESQRPQVTDGQRREPIGVSPGHESQHRQPRAVRRHAVVDGDSLQKIAKKYLGNPDAYLDVYELNRDVLARPDVLPLGVELKIPQWPTRIEANGQGEKSGRSRPGPTMPDRAIGTGLVPVPVAKAESA